MSYTGMQAKLSSDGKSIIIKIPIHDIFSPSKKTGKTLLVASSQGTHKTGIILQGSDVRVTANAFIPNPEFKKEKKQKKLIIGPRTKSNRDDLDDF